MSAVVQSEGRTGSKLLRNIRPACLRRELGERGDEEEQPRHRRCGIRHHHSRQRLPYIHTRLLNGCGGATDMQRICGGRLERIDAAVGMHTTINTVGRDHSDDNCTTGIRNTDLGGCWSRELSGVLPQDGRQ